MKTYAFSELPSLVVSNGNFDDTCSLILSPKTLTALTQKRLRIKIRQHGSKSTISDLNVFIGSIFGDINIWIGHNNSKVSLGENTSGKYDLRLWINSTISIGNSTTSHGTRIICSHSEFSCGKDCMFSDDVLVQTADQHGIVDTKTGEIVNNAYKSVILGNHVWLGRRCTLTSNAKIGNGSIIGTGAIVTGTIPKKVVAVGAPARIVKENRTWSRSPFSLDEWSKQYIEN